MPQQDSLPDHTELPDVLLQPDSLPSDRTARKSASSSVQAVGEGASSCPSINGNRSTPGASSSAWQAGMAAQQASLAQLSSGIQQLLSTHTSSSFLSGAMRLDQQAALQALEEDVLDQEYASYWRDSLPAEQSAAASVGAWSCSSAGLGLQGHSRLMLPDFGPDEPGSNVYPLAFTDGRPSQLTLTQTEDGIAAQTGFLPTDAQEQLPQSGDVLPPPSQQQQQQQQQQAEGQTPPPQQQQQPEDHPLPPQQQQQQQDEVQALRQQHAAQGQGQVPQQQQQQTWQAADHHHHQQQQPVRLQMPHGGLVS